MNILFITETLPYPQDSGGKIVSFKLLQRLARQHSIFLFTFIYQKDKKYVQKLKQILRLKHIYAIPHFLIFSNNFKLEKPAMLRSLFSANPYNVNKFYSPELKESITKILTREKIDAIWVDHVNMSQYVPPDYQRKVNLVAHNLETILYLRHALYAHKWRWKVFFAVECIKFFFYERSALQKFSTIYTLSKTDIQYIKFLLQFCLDRKRIERRLKVLPNRYFLPKVKRKLVHRGENTILFIGNMVWYPNYQGILWFISEVFPLVLKENPLARLVIVGEAPDHLLKSSYQNITFTGHVKKLQSYYEQTRVFIVPLFIGSGIRIKILEALSYQIPVVSTTTGSEGIPLSLKKKIHLANTPTEFMNEILKILTGS